MLMAAPLSAQITTYSTRSAFSSAAGPLTTESFNSCGTSTVTLGVGADLSSSSLGPCASIQSGVTFATNANTELYIAGPGQSANATTALGINIPLGAAHQITFSTAIRAFGVDLFQNMAGGGQSGSAQPFFAEVFGTSGSLGTFNFDIASQTGGFFGFTSLVDVTEVRIGQETGFAVMDDVSFSPTTAVPEPSTALLVAPALLLLAASARRRRSSAL